MCYNQIMIDLGKYADMKICVAVSGGKDSMALLHYLYEHAREYGIALSALNCNHKIRGEASARDSLFVKNWCKERNIPFTLFEWDYDGVKTEASARQWRRECYSRVAKNGTRIATAHHLNDNAETVLFNLARGSALSGLTGIVDCGYLIRPLISCTRGEIDAYIAENGVPYVEDESNFTDAYTRNKIRHNVLPGLEKAVPDAAQAIYRFSRLAAEDESYFERLIEKQNVIKSTAFGEEIRFCEEKAVFKRAVVRVVKDKFNRKDYTSLHAERLYNLQFAENGKRFVFLNLTAYKEGGKIVICESADSSVNEILFKDYCGKDFCGQTVEISEAPEEGRKALKFDPEAVPDGAVIRFMKQGDKFTKFGGGTKSLGDYFTDKKIPVRIRARVPLIADGSEVLAVCGVEISDKIKITESTKKILYLLCDDYLKLI